MSVEGVNATALRSLRCDSALMSALQRLNADRSAAAAKLGSITSGIDTLGMPSVLRPLALPAFWTFKPAETRLRNSIANQRRSASLR